MGTITSYRLKVRTLDFHSNNVGSSPASLRNKILLEFLGFYGEVAEWSKAADCNSVR